MLRALGEKKELILALSGTFWGFDSEERKELILALSGTFWGLDMEKKGKNSFGTSLFALRLGRLE